MATRARTNTTPNRSHFKKKKKMLPVLQNTIVMTISKCPMTYFPPHMCNDTALKPYTVLTPHFLLEEAQVTYIDNLQDKQCKYCHWSNRCVMVRRFSMASK